MASRNVIVSTLRVAAVGAALVTACSPRDGSDNNLGSLFATGAGDRVAVTLSLERALTTPGEPVDVAASVRLEGGPGPRVLWRSSGCELSGSIHVGPVQPANATDAVSEDPANLAVVLVRSLIGNVDEQAAVIAQPLGDTRLTSCRLDHGFAELVPGDRLSEIVAWPARTVLGAPSAPGSYVVAFAFPLLRPDVETVPAAFEGARDLRPVRAELPLIVAPPIQPVLAADEAIERMLEDSRLTAWIQAQPEANLRARLQYAEGRWLLEIASIPRGTARAWLDGQGRGLPTVTIDGS